MSTRIVRRALTLLVALCWAPSCTTTQDAEPRSTNETTGPTEPSEPSLQPGEVVLAPGPCARIRGQWTCLPEGHVLTTRPDVVAADGVWGEGLCMLDGDRKLECVIENQPPQRFEDVSAFELAWPRLVIARKTKLEQINLVSGHRREIETGVELAEVSGLCGRSIDGALACGKAALTGVEQFCAGNDHVCALVDSKVLCSGSNSSGELGLGHHAFVNEAEQSVVGLPPAVAIDCGSDYSCALTQTGEVWCWGADGPGQLGRGGFVGASASAAPVRGLERVAGMRLFDDYGCAVLADGSMQCWGDVPKSVAERLPQRDPCVEVSLEDWQARLEAAETGWTIIDILDELGLHPNIRQPGQSKQPKAATKLRKVYVRSVELDGAAPSERVVEVWLEGEGNLRVAATLLRGDERGRWCTVADLSESQVYKDQASGPIPGRPDAMPPQELEFVELLAPGRSVIARHWLGGQIGYIQVTAHQLTYLELREGELVEIFGPFTLHESGWEVDQSPTPGTQPTITGRIELTGEFPRTIESETTVDCRGVRGRCKRGTTRKTWTFDGTAYR